MRSDRLPRLAIVFLACAFVAQAQPYLNLDFETATRGRLRTWYQGGTGYDIQLDASQAVSGKQCLRIRYVDAAPNVLGVVSQSFPLEAVRGRRFSFTGYVKSEGITRNNAALWWRVDGTGRTLFLDNAPPPTAPLRGTTAWTRYEIAGEVSPDAVGVVFGVFHSGDGTAWFDNLQVEIDGAPFQQGPEPFIGEPAPEQLDWIRRNAIPFDTPEAEKGFADLQPLKQLIGNARVVGLGEATHGTSEFFRMKHRLTEFLATEMGFTIFAIEANMPEAYRVNDYVVTGRGDPKELLKGMYFWTWNTQEVLDMIEWMRRFNQSGKGRIQFVGFDMQYWSVAGDIVRAFVEKADPLFLPTLNQAYHTVKEAAATSTGGLGTVREAAGWAARLVRQYLEARRQHYLAGYTVAEVDWAIQNARVVEQAAWVRIDAYHRDRAMALNTQWILEQNPGAKAVLWAHNGHVYKGPYAQGLYLAQRYGKDYVVLGFAFHEGRYNAVGSRGLVPYDAVPSFPGSIEYVFHQTGLPRFILDLRKASASDPASAWLLGENEFRSIGAVPGDGFYITRTLTQDYDALIYFDQTSPSVLLR